MSNLALNLNERPNMAKKTENNQEPIEKHAVLPILRTTFFIL